MAHPQISRFKLLGEIFLRLNTAIENYFSDASYVLFVSEVGAPGLGFVLGEHAHCDRRIAVHA